MVVTRNRESNMVDSSKFVLTMVILLIILIFSVLAAIMFGNADISMHEVYSVIFYELFHMDRYASYFKDSVHDVVWLIRLPRVLLALCVGMGLSVCGVIMQAIVKNPLADPYVLGISSGASLGATLAIMLGIGTFLGDNFVGIMAFVGAMISAFAVMSIANVAGRANSGKLILSGMAVGAICSAFSNFALYIANNRNATAEVTYWMLGSLAGAKWDKLAVTLPVIMIGTFIFWTQFRNLNLMLLGDEVSVTLGTNLAKIRTLYMILVSVMVGFAVYSAGMIGFVGLIIPHVIRMIFGTDHRKTVPLSALLGAIFLIWADVACRVIMDNSEMPIGILVSMIGAPCFIYLMIRKSYGFGGSK